MPGPGGRDRLVHARSREPFRRINVVDGDMLVKQALSASARARTGGPTSAVGLSASTASSQASPSWMRPRDNHSGCSDDASPARARCPVFACSRRMRLADCRSRFRLLDPLVVVTARTARRAARPSRCSGRGGGTGRRRPRRTRRASPARTGAPFPAAGIAFGRRLFSATTSDLSTSRVSWSRTW